MSTVSLRVAPDEPVLYDGYYDGIAELESNQRDRGIRGLATYADEIQQVPEELVARLPAGAEGTYVVAEYFRDGEEPLFGYIYDGGFAMGDDLDFFEADHMDEDLGDVTTSTGESGADSDKASFGSLSSGGLY